LINKPSKTICPRCGHKLPKPDLRCPGCYLEFEEDGHSSSPIEETARTAFPPYRSMSTYLSWFGAGIGAFVSLYLLRPDASDIMASGLTLAIGGGLGGELTGRIQYAILKARYHKRN
jgi:hypothetical protein